MNFQSAKKKVPASWWGHPCMHGMMCCASGEAVVAQADSNRSPEKKVEQCIDNALWGGKTWLHWYLVKGTDLYDNVG